MGVWRAILSKKTDPTNLLSLFRSRQQLIPQSPFEVFLQGLFKKTSDRPVRRVVTPSGHRARGCWPARKCIGKASYESLVELNAWKTLDTSNLIRCFITHPVVLQLRANGRPFNYTPDAVFRAVLDQKEIGVVLEVKARYFLTKKSARERMQHIANALRASDLNYALILDTDLNPDFLSRMTSLWDQLPVAGRWSPHRDPDIWDPRGQTQSSQEVCTAWKTAKAECDALLQKVMRRDPGDLDGLLQAT